jgi:uncharacterized protein (DUF362 family)
MKTKDTCSQEEGQKENNGMVSRRVFLKSSVIGLTSMAIPAMPGCAVLDPEPLPPTGVFPPMPPATVAVSGGIERSGTSLVFDSLDNAIREAVEAGGGLSAIQSGDRVMVKPNSSGAGLDSTYSACTHPEALRVVFRMIKERGATPILSEHVCFRPGGIPIPWDEEAYMEAAGYTSVVEEEAAQILLWKDDDWIVFKPGKRHWSRGFRMPKSLTEIDHWINVPTIKNHNDGQPSGGARFTACLKNFVGVIHTADRWQLGLDALHTKNIGEKVAEINLCSAPLMNIVDATEILTLGGPAFPVYQFGIPNLVLASTDRVACDTVAFCVIKEYGIDGNINQSYVNEGPFEQVTMYYAAELGIGQVDPDQITVLNVNDSEPRFNQIMSHWA